MSAPQTIPTIHPQAELQETAFMSGILRQRSLMLASENIDLKERIKALEATEKTLQAQIEHFQAQLAEHGERGNGDQT
ncbi:hypothetical protein [Pseudochrobactrum asaccharolyticum]|uniref:hypothetical protein n=1 Tax=Pseudochrobactrum asaccharolyticum TaxID=354351 RepID=UPI004042031E